MTTTTIEQLHYLQRSNLHDAATTFELDAEDAAVLGGNYCLVFRSQHNAIKVAKLAAKQMEKETNRLCLPVILIGDHHIYATVQFSI